MANGPPSPQVVIPGAGWVDVASRVVVQVGFPVVVAGVLLWYVLGSFQRNMDLITTRMERNADAVNGFVAELRVQTTELKAQTGYLSEQGKVIGRIAEDASHLVELRRQERDDRRKQGGP